MRVRLLVKRVPEPQTGFSATLWTEGDARLVEWKDFSGTVTLGVWLAGIAGKYGRNDVLIDWTEQMKADGRLAEAVSSVFGEPGGRDSAP
jgi:hypothetical protein